MQIYKHEQRGTLVLATLGAGMLLIVGILTQMPSHPALTAMITVLVILGACLLLFFKLTVQVSKHELRFAFGLGLIRRRYQVEEIQSAKSVRNRWWYGCGIRLTPHGWLYNVSGLEAVEVQLASGKTFRIGTDDPGGLVSAIEVARRGKI